MRNFKLPKKNQEFDYNKPCKTRTGQSVTIVVFKDKILGVVTLEDEDGLLCDWSLAGLKNSLYPREAGEKHNLDLVNIDD